MRGRIVEADGLMEKLKSLLDSQPLAVLATEGQGRPYVNLVAFAAIDDLSRLFFVTGRSTRKFSNLGANSSVALLVDNRSNQVEDFSTAVAATVIGTAREINGEERERCITVYLRKHPHLRDFVVAPGNALIKVTVETYVVVSRFQEVTTLRVSA